MVDRPVRDVGSLVVRGSAMGLNKPCCCGSDTVCSFVLIPHQSPLCPSLPIPSKMSVLVHGLVLCTLFWICPHHLCLSLCLSILHLSRLSDCPLPRPVLLEPRLPAPTTTCMTPSVHPPNPPPTTCYFNCPPPAETPWVGWGYGSLQTKGCHRH